MQGLFNLGAKKFVVANLGPTSTGCVYQAKCSQMTDNLKDGKESNYSFGKNYTYISNLEYTCMNGKGKKTKINK